jgi:hypothetical protein
MERLTFDELIDGGLNPDEALKALGMPSYDELQDLADEQQYYLVEDMRAAEFPDEHATPEERRAMWGDDYDIAERIRAKRREAR